MVQYVGKRPFIDTTCMYVNVLYIGLQPMQNDQNVEKRDEIITAGWEQRILLVYLIKLLAQELDYK